MIARLVGPNNRILSDPVMGTDPRRYDLSTIIEAEIRLRLEGNNRIIQLYQDDLTKKRRFCSLIELGRHGSCSVGILPSVAVRVLVTTHDDPVKTIFDLRIDLPVFYAARLVSDHWQPPFITDGSCFPLGTALVGADSEQLSRFETKIPLLTST